MKKIIKDFLLNISKRIIKKYNPEVVAITGSFGKTSVKEISTQILKIKFRVASGQDSYNTALGLALTIIGKTAPETFFGWLKVLGKGLKLWLIKDNNYPEVLILEMAANKPGDLKKYALTLPFNMGVVTAVSATHLEFFKTIKKVALEKRWVVANLAKTGVAVLNRDDEEVYQMRKKTDADVITFGYNSESDIRASDVNLKINEVSGWPEGLMIKVTYKGAVVPFYLPGVVGSHIVYPFLASIGISLSLGMNMVDISQALQKIKTMPGRMRIISGIKQSLLIDDSYNAAPEAVSAALNTLVKINIKEKGERYAVLADMLELGNSTEEYHKEIGRKVAELGVDFFITVGEAMKTAVAAAKEAGLAEHSLASFNTAEEAGKFLQEKLKPGDVVLIKGSRAMHMEKVVKEVMAEPARAGELIVNCGYCK